MTRPRLHWPHPATALLAVIVACATTTTGCNSNFLTDRFDLKKGIPWPTASNKRKNPPEKVVAFWSEAVHHQTGQPSQRGFGGRLYFYNRSDDEPLRVEGQLVVYAFDEANRDPTDNRPTRRFVFPPGQFAKHCSDSDVGPSYSVWLPWDDVGGEAKEIGLIARFEPVRGGSVVVSEQSQHRLPGRMPASPAVAPGDGPQLAAPTGSAVGPVTAATFEQPLGASGEIQHATGPTGTVGMARPSDFGQTVAPTTMPQRRMTTTSIAVPRSFGRDFPRAAVQNTRPSAGQDQPITLGLPPRTEANPQTSCPSEADRRAAEARSRYWSWGGPPQSRINSSALSRPIGFQLPTRRAPEGGAFPQPASHPQSQPGPIGPPSGH